MLDWAVRKGGTSIGEIPRAVRFDRFMLDLRTGELRRNGRRLKLQERPFQVLSALLDRPGDLVTREELRLRLWPADTFVDFDNGLNTAVAKLRHVLGDSVSHPRFVETPPGRGYRFIATLETSEPAARSDRAPESRSVGAPLLVDAPAPPSAAAVAVRRGAAPWGRRWTAGLVVAGAVLTIAIVAGVIRGGSPGPPAAHALVFASDASHREPSLSPDGSLVAFISTAAGTPQVWIKNLAQGEPMQITWGEVAAGSPRWSPRGDQILFNRAGQGIWSVGPLGTPEPRRLIENGRNASMSADSRLLVFERARHIWTADADGNNQRQVEGTPVPWTSDVPSSPAFSPDGRSIAFFLAEAGPNGDFWVIASTGGEPRRLTWDVCEGGEHLFTIASDGSGLRQVTHRGGEWNIHPTWSGDGRYLYYYRERPAPVGFRRIAVDGGSSQDVIPSWQWQWQRQMHARVNPTGSRLVYSLQGDDRVEVTVVRDLDTGQEMPLPLPHLHNPQWQADGSIVGYRHDGTIVSCAADGGRCVVIARGVRPVVVRDGGPLFFQRPAAEAHHVELWMAGPDGADPRKIREVGRLAPLSYSFSASPGLRLAWTEFRPGRHELWRLTLDGPQRQ